MKKILKDAIKPIINRVAELMDSEDEERILGRIALLSKRGKDDDDCNAMIEVALIGYAAYMKETT